MTQYTDTPQGPDQRNQSQVDLLNNNRYLLNISNPGTPTGILPVDHLATGDNTANPSDGFHKQVSFTNRPANVTTLVNSVNGQSSNAILYTRLNGGVPSRTEMILFTNDNAQTFNYALTGLKACVAFTNALAIVGNSQNVSSITAVGTGFRVNYAVALPNTNYSVFVSYQSNSTTTRAVSLYANKTTTSVEVYFFTLGNAPVAPAEMSVQVFGFY